jgi:hypothetical protein
VENVLTSHFPDRIRKRDKERVMASPNFRKIGEGQEKGGQGDARQLLISALISRIRQWPPASSETLRDRAPVQYNSWTSPRPSNSMTAIYPTRSFFWGGASPPPGPLGWTPIVFRRSSASVLFHF